MKKEENDRLNDIEVEKFITTKRLRNYQMKVESLSIELERSKQKLSYFSPYRFGLLLKKLQNYETKMK